MRTIDRQLDRSRRGCHCRFSGSGRRNFSWRSRLVRVGRFVRVGRSRRRNFSRFRGFERRKLSRVGGSSCGYHGW
jgi:hypothetical protein